MTKVVITAEVGVIDEIVDEPISEAEARALANLVVTGPAEIVNVEIVDG